MQFCISIKFYHFQLVIGARISFNCSQKVARHEVHPLSAGSTVTHMDSYFKDSPQPLEIRTVSGFELGPFGL